jgi:hypothetical protein
MQQQNINIHETLQEVQEKSIQEEDNELLFAAAKHTQASTIEDSLKPLSAGNSQVFLGKKINKQPLYKSKVD